MVFREHYASLVRYGTTILKDTDESKDVVQQVFVSAWEKRTQLDIHTSVRAMLYKAVHNACLNRLKHKKVRAAYASDFQSVHQEAESGDLLQAKELQQRIQQAVELLPEQCARIFKMSRFEQLKYQEIAEKTGLSIKTVENQMGKALRIIRQELSDYLPLLILFFISEL